MLSGYLVGIGERRRVVWLLCPVDLAGEIRQCLNVGPVWDLLTGISWPWWCLGTQFLIAVHDLVSLACLESWKSYLPISGSVWFLPSGDILVSTRPFFYSRLAVPLQPLPLPLRWWSSGKPAGSQVSIHINGECYISNVQVACSQVSFRFLLKSSMISQPHNTFYAPSCLAFTVILHILYFTSFLLNVCLSPTRI